MEKVKVTIEIPVTKLADLQRFLSGPIAGEDFGKGYEPQMADAAPMAARSAEKPEPATEKHGKSSAANEPVTKSDLRAAGVELTKADKRKELSEIFAKYGAENLRTLKEEHYAAALKDMKEALS